MVQDKALVKIGYYKDTRHDEIAQNMDTILGSTDNKIGRVYTVVWRERESSL